MGASKSREANFTEELHGICNDSRTEISMVTSFTHSEMSLGNCDRINFKISSKTGTYIRERSGNTLQVTYKLSENTIEQLLNTFKTAEFNTITTSTSKAFNTSGSDIGTSIVLVNHAKRFRYEVRQSERVSVDAKYQKAFEAIQNKIEDTNNQYLSSNYVKVHLKPDQSVMDKFPNNEPYRIITDPSSSSSSNHLNVILQFFPSSLPDEPDASFPFYVPKPSDDQKRSPQDDSTTAHIIVESDDDDDEDNFDDKETRVNIDDENEDPQRRKDNASSMQGKLEVEDECLYQLSVEGRASIVGKQL
eukprot:gb/GECH01002947.1/.p1 GENE.gb/GECH01002947.1/~~gb/GECH01002947.1/.p1  ORF type:complete len:304 (+),score=73.80 gb/GECH01002947.1/:1-912(+)